MFKSNQHWVSLVIIHNLLLIVQLHVTYDARLWLRFTQLWLKIPNNLHSWYLNQHLAHFTQLILQCWFNLEDNLWWVVVTCFGVWTGNWCHQSMQRHCATENSIMVLIFAGMPMQNTEQIIWQLSATVYSIFENAVNAALWFIPFLYRAQVVLNICQ